MPLYFPVSSINGHRAQPTSGFRTRHRPNHDGVDLCFLRAAGLEEDLRSNHGKYAMPKNAIIVAPDDGVVEYAFKHDNGWRVRTRSWGERCWLGFHLDRLAPGIERDLEVRGGTALGWMGWDPNDGEELPHDHVECRLGAWGSSGQVCIDPEDVWRRYKPTYLDYTEVHWVQVEAPAA